MLPEFVELALPDRVVLVEYQRIACSLADAPLLIFIHEGLGSVSMWRDFPQRICEAGQYRGLVYSRPGYGNSTPRAAREKWQPDYLQREADDVLPALLHALDLGQTGYWLFGHSDGASIALLHAASHRATRGAIVLAPHVFVEQISLDGIKLTVEKYRTGGLEANLARYHAEPDSPFYGWSDAWLAPAFRDWNIEAQVAQIRCPLLVMQGEGDEYGTMAQLDRIKAALPHSELLKLADCGHIPQRDRPQDVIDATIRFVAAHP
ncbi:MAG TPA: alpha/beta hydrolase [Burkholderiaceae bacterium]|jgi:pimeloyl-ACP methyl ester carboxylesterase